MSALTVLYMILTFPVAFILHDAEEIAVQHSWMLNHRKSLIKTFPKMKRMVEQLSGLTTKAFAIAATEELTVILVATAYVLVGGVYSMQIWSALFMAFSTHLVVHVFQAIVMRGYVPGLVSTLLLIPYAFIAMQSIWNAMSGTELAAWGLLGIIIMAVNLRFAHWLGMKMK